MRKFKVEEPIELNRHNDEVIRDELLWPLYGKVMNDDVVKTGANASQVEGQSSYAELLAKTVQLDPYSPYVYIDKMFQTPKKYVKSELDWYKSMDLSIIGHEGIESNPTWQSCCTKDDKKEINSNYGWCVFSEENGSQYDECLNVLKKDKLPLRQYRSNQQQNYKLYHQTYRPYEPLKIYQQERYCHLP